MTTKTEEVTAFGCLEACWALAGLAMNCGLNSTLWYMLLTHIDATPTMWAVFYAYVPVHCVVAFVSMVLGFIRKAISS